MTQIQFSSGMSGGLWDVLCVSAYRKEVYRWCEWAKKAAGRPLSGAFVPSPVVVAYRRPIADHGADCAEGHELNG